MKKEKLGLYFNLLVNDKLNEYIHDIDTIVMEKVQKLIKELTEKENITEELKSSNQMLWIGKMNNIKDIAEEIALKRNIMRMSNQAVGQAVSKNPISIIVPCHRVIGTDGSLTGYASGVDKKKFLLELEMHGNIDKETVD